MNGSRLKPVMRALLRLLYAVMFANGFWACEASRGGSAPMTVRRIEGILRPGRIVSPYSYEWFIRAELYAARGDDEQAIKAYRLALTGPDEDPFVLARLALALDREGHAQLAAEVLESAEEIDDNSEAVWMARAQIARNHGDVSAAIRAYQKAEKVAPHSSEPSLGLADLLYQQGLRERAIAVLEAFIRRSGPSGVNPGRVSLELSLAREDLIGSVEALKALQRIIPIRDKELCRVAQLAINSSRPFIADRVVRLFGEKRINCEPQLHLLILLDTGQFEAAEHLLLSKMPDSFGGLIATAQAYLSIGKPEMAEQLAEVAVARNPSSQAVVALAEAKLLRGEPAAAAHLFANVLPQSRLWKTARIGILRSLAVSNMNYLAVELLVSMFNPDDGICSAIGGQEPTLGLVDYLTTVYSGSLPLPSIQIQAYLLDLKGNIEQASKIYSQLGKQSSQLPISIRARALAELSISKGDLANAINLLNERVQTAPEDRLARIRLAEIQYLVGDIEGSRLTKEAVLPLIWEPPLQNRLKAIQ